MTNNDQETFESFRYQRNAAMGEEVRAYFHENSVEAHEQALDNAKSSWEITMLCDGSSI